MQGAIPTPQDNNMLLQDTTTKTASFNSDGFDLGSGFQPGGLGVPAAAVVDVSAGTRADSDETYVFKLQESADNSNWNDCGATQAVTVSGSTFSTGVYVARGLLTKRYARLVLTAAGTTPSITYKAWLNMVAQR